MEAFPPEETLSELIPSQEASLLMSLFTRDAEIELQEAQPYNLEDELDLPPPFDSEESNCACN